MREGGLAPAQTPRVHARAPLSHLVKQRVQHADAEHSAGGEREAEHEGQVGALVPLHLERGTVLKSHLFPSVYCSDYLLHAQHDYAEYFCSLSTSSRGIL